MAIGFTSIPQNFIQGFTRGKLINEDNVADFIYIHYIPEELTETTEAQWDQENDVIGRSVPYIYYRSTSARFFEITLHLFAQEDAREEVLKRARWVQSFCYPSYSSQLATPPRSLRIILGQDFINMKGVLRSLPLEWKAPYDLITGISHYATIVVNILEVVDVPLTAEDFRPKTLRRREGQSRWG